MIGGYSAMYARMGAPARKTRVYLNPEFCEEAVNSEGAASLPPPPKPLLEKVSLFPLHAALYKMRPAQTFDDQDQKEFITLLHTYRADINQKDEEGNTPLHMAAFIQSSRFTVLLLRYGADPTSVNKRRQAPIHVAAKVRNRKIVIFYLILGVSIDFLEERYPHFSEYRAWLKEQYDAIPDSQRFKGVDLPLTRRAELPPIPKPILEAYLRGLLECDDLFTMNGAGLYRLVKKFSHARHVCIASSKVGTDDIGLVLHLDGRALASLFSLAQEASARAGGPASPRSAAASPLSAAASSSQPCFFSKREKNPVYYRDAQEIETQFSSIKLNAVVPPAPPSSSISAKADMGDFCTAHFSYSKKRED
jgi:hypothetical protein